MRLPHALAFSKIRYIDWLFENATACSKCMLKTRVATGLKRKKGHFLLFFLLSQEPLHKYNLEERKKYYFSICSPIKMFGVTFQSSSGRAVWFIKNPVRACPLGTNHSHTA